MRFADRKGYKYFFCIVMLALAVSMAGKLAYVSFSPAYGVTTGKIIVITGNAGHGRGNNTTRVSYEFIGNGKPYQGKDKVLMGRFYKDATIKIYFSKNDPARNGLIASLTEYLAASVLALLLVQDELAAVFQWLGRLLGRRQH